MKLSIRRMLGFVSRSDRFVSRFVCWFVSWFVSGLCLVRVRFVSGFASGARLGRLGRVWVRSLDIKYLPTISLCRHEISISLI